MENKVRAGDVWWNNKHGYGKIYMQVETSMPDVVREYLVHNKARGHSTDCSWESGGLGKVGRTKGEEWVFLYNIVDLTTLSLKALNEEHST